MARSMPDFTREAALVAQGLAVAGIDEVGRGPLAGPVVAGAVILDPARIPPGLDDSKRLSARERQRLDAALRESAHVGIGLASVEEVDGLDVRRATLLAMARAVAALPAPAGAALVDGRDLPALGIPATGIVGGDRLSLSVAAASIVAKVWRDRHMAGLAALHPAYGWDRNKGYGTAQHLAALRVHGPTPHHRRSFAPLRGVMATPHVGLPESPPHPGSL